MNSISVTKGAMTLRLAHGLPEVAACQKLRYRVFYEEMGARPVAGHGQDGTDADRFDAICDHLLVVRHTDEISPGMIAVDGGELVGTYRLLRQEVAEAHGGFYTEGEFAIAPLLAAHPGLKFLELGRSCVLAAHRTKPVVELLWQGIWNYVRHHGLDVMFGCASFEGNDAAAYAPALALLARNFAAPEEWRVKASAPGSVAMDPDPAAAIDEKAALKALPTLIKGYLRLGCYIGDGAVIDEQFNTIDVLIVLPVSVINPRYFAHFGQPND